MLGKISKILLFLSLTWLSAACIGSRPVASSSNPGGREIDPLFREFYSYLGGKEKLGEVISVVFDQDNVKYQFTEAALMVYDPHAPATQRFQLAPLGLEIVGKEPPIPVTGEPDGLFVDGHMIAPEFLRLYQELGGGRFIGRPLTEIRYNSEKQRYEQYFENVGFFYLDDNSTSQARLLSYGAWKCDSSCREATPQNSILDLYPELSPPFKETVDRLGPSFTGYALTEPYIAPDGKLEQVFANVVLVADAEDSQSVSLRPILKSLGIKPGPLEDPSGEQDMVFYPVEGGKGYNIPQAFMDYLDQRGGIAVSGPPIDSYVSTGEDIYRQCFVNLCLDDHRDPSEAIYIRPAPLGYQYKDRFVQSTVLPDMQPGQGTDVPPGVGTALPPSSQTPNPNQEVLRKISLQVWEREPMIVQNRTQEIGVRVLENNAPFQNVPGRITRTLPDGKQETYSLPPTNDDGQTSLSLPPVTAGNGTLIPYEVCISVGDRTDFCVLESYLIWDSRALDQGYRGYLPMIIRAMMEKLHFHYLPGVQK